ncbi:MAG: outer membrane beta-barrel protein [Gammaproteobacteria bacterium]|nr:outer membrane beta-barrel protein [Gammaproteobacteria bacterium]
MKRTIFTHKYGLIAIIALAGLLTTMVARADDNPWYVGLSLGQANYGSDVEDAASLLNQELTSLGYANTITYSKTDTGYVPRVGYRFNKYFSLEANYFNMGTANLYGTITSPVSATADISVKLTGFGIDAVGNLPLNDMWSLFANAGLIEASIKENVGVSSGITGIANSESSNNTTYDIGGGVQLNIENNWAFRLGYMQFHNVGDSNTTGSGNVNYAYLGAFYYF